MPFNDCYVSSKFALEGFSECQASYLHRFGIHVSLVEPGPILTDFINRVEKDHKLPEPNDAYSALTPEFEKVAQVGSAQCILPSVIYGKGTCSIDCSDCMHYVQSRCRPALTDLPRIKVLAHRCCEHTCSLQSQADCLHAFPGMHDLIVRLLHCALHFVSRIHESIEAPMLKLSCSAVTGQAKWAAFS